MSVVFCKVDRKNRHQSMYSDGTCISGFSVVDNRSRKVSILVKDGLNILIGTTGVADFGRYMRMNAERVLVTSEFKDLVFSRADRIEEMEEYISKSFRTLMDGYINEKKPKSSQFKGGNVLLCANGYIIKITVHYDDLIEVSVINGYSFYAIGSGTEAVMCMLDADIDPQSILSTLSKYNCCVNDKLFTVSSGWDEFPIRV